MSKYSILHVNFQTKVRERREGNGRKYLVIFFCFIYMPSILSFTMAIPN